MSASITIPKSINTSKFGIELVANRVFASIDPDAQLWLQLPRETETLYSRFQFYLMLGEERTVLAAYNKYRASIHSLPPTMKVPLEWKRAASAWRWRERAQAFDRNESKKRLKAYEKDQELNREARLKFASQFKQLLVESMEAFDPAEQGVRLSELTSAFRVLGQELRAEWDSEPAQRQEVTITSMADLIRAARQEKERNQDSVIDAEFR